MADLGLQTFDKLYPMLVKKYKNLSIDQNADIPDKINQIVNQLNALGKLSNDVVRDWNTVYNWAMNDGLTTDVNNKIEAMNASGELNSILTSLFNSEIGDLTTLQTVDKTNVVAAINDNVVSLAQKATQYYKDVKKDYGAKGDGTTDDTTALNNCSAYCEQNGLDMVIPAGTYKITSAFIVPCYVKVITQGIVIIKAYHTTGDVVSCSRTDQWKPNYDLQKIQITAATTPNTLNGLHLGCSTESTFKDIQITSTQSTCVYIHPEGQNDCISFAFDRIRTSGTGGIVLETNNSIAHGNITIGRFSDCSIFTRNDVGDPTVKFISHTGTTIFCINIENMNSGNGTAAQFDLQSDDTGGIYGCKFNNFYGEIVPPSTSTPFINMKNVNYSTFDVINGFTTTGGVVLTGCNNNVFKNLHYQGSSATNDYILNIDANSYNNTFENFAIDDYVINLTGSSNQMYDVLFNKCIVDNGRNTQFVGGVIKNYLKCLNDTTQLLNVNTSNNTFNHYTVINGTATVTLADSQTAQVVYPAGVSGVRHTFNITTSAKFIGVRVRYKVVTTGFTMNGGTGKLGFWTNNTANSITLNADGNWHDDVFVVPYTSAQFAFGFSGAPSVAVTVQYQAIEIYEGYGLPYLPHYHIINGVQ